MSMGIYEPWVDVLLGGAKNLHSPRAVDFGVGAYVPLGFDSSGPPAIGDFNHDGKLDIAIAATGIF